MNRTAYQWLKEKFPKGHPLGAVRGQINPLGFTVQKIIPQTIDQSALYEPKPQRSEVCQKEWKDGDWVSIVRFDEHGVYVMAFATDEICIPYSFLKKISFPEIIPTKE